MKISAVILSFNSIKYLDKCIHDLVDSLVDFEKEIFIVDNGSTDGSAEKIKELESEFADVKGIFFHENTGTTYSRNSALKRATGDFILVLDSDAYVNREAVNRLTGYLANNKKCGIAAPKLTYLNGKYQKSTDQFPTLVSKFKRFFFLRKIEQNESALEIREKDVETVISAFWLFRKDVLDKVGLLDEKIFYSPEDIDYCIRIWKAGYSIRYLPDVSVIHDAQEISRSRGLKINKFTFSHAKGIFYLLLKHRYFFSKPVDLSI